MSRRCQSDMFLFDSSVLCRGAIGEIGWIVGLIVAAVGAVYARRVLLLLVGLGTLILLFLVTKTCFAALNAASTSKAGSAACVVVSFP